MPDLSRRTLLTLAGGLAAAAAFAPGTARALIAGDPAPVHADPVEADLPVPDAPIEAINHGRRHFGHRRRRFGLRRFGRRRRLGRRFFFGRRGFEFDDGHIRSRRFHRRPHRFFFIQ